MAADDDFLVEELFFSTTDRKGVIRSCNGVFERIAGYSAEELIGKPHNIIRHPDMPRAVFQKLWDTILAGDPIAAYVKNRRKDGGYYWVLASVVPAGDEFLSIRLKPTSELLPVVEKVYAELRTLELGIEGGEGKARKRAIEASTARLGELLAGLGFASYEDFMHVALQTELSARDDQVARGAERLSLDGDHGLTSIHARVRRSGAWLDSLFTNLGRYRTLNEGLAERSAFVSELADAIGLFSLNALIKATRLGERGAALGAVADLMGQRSHRIGEAVGGLTGEIDETVRLLHRVSFEIALCKLQTEMAGSFALELLEHEEADPRREARLRGDIGMLARKVADEVEALADVLGRLEGHLGRIRGAAGALAADLDVLRALQMNGKVEAAHLDDAADVEALFAQIRDQLDEASGRTAAFVDITRAGAAREVGVPSGLARDLAELRVLADVVSASQRAAA